MQRCPHSSAPEGAGCCIKALRLRSTRCQASPAAELNETDPSRGGGRLWSRFSRSIGSSQSTNKSLLIAAAGRTESASKCVRCMPLDGISEGYRCYTARDRAKVRAGKCKPPVRKKMQDANCKQACTSQLRQRQQVCKQQPFNSAVFDRLQILS